MIYLDTSATAKLVLAEEETRALELHVRAARAPMLTSRVGMVELRRVAARAPLAVARAEALIGSLLVVELDRAIEQIAVSLAPPLRTLDAIHLASALAVGTELREFVCYDERLAAAARDAGLGVISPGR